MEQHAPLIITQNDEAEVLMQDIDRNEQTRETMALLRILALGMRRIEEGKVSPAEDVIKRLREQRKDRAKARHP